VAGPVIVIGRKGNAGAVHLLQEACWPIDTTYFIRIPPCFDPGFLAYQLTQANLGSLDSSTAIPSLRRPDLESCRIRVAPIDEQRRIVASIEEQFSRLDAGVTALRSAERRLESFRLSVLQRMRDGPWEWVAFGDLVENHDGKRVPVKAALRREGPYPYYGAQGIIDYVDGFLFDGDFVLVAEDGANLSSRVLPIALQAHGKFWVNNHAHVVKPKPAILADYLTAVLNADSLAGAITGTAQPKLPQKALNRLLIPTPPLEVQRSLVAYLERARTSYETTRDLLERTDRRINSLRSSILASAFSGKLALRVTGDEPASVVLARLAAKREPSNGSTRRNPHRRWRKVTA
jgi:type I restriction enzyme S subunit